eukprot:TRINITY_DN7805_c0_g1_i1.p2 TRINITY_DN7805_c0_g1~~TRINITY_DN7805_c0_g1_i1.p2  ORF type:complete len:92 (-),score=2.36 TRINITY_DN7805_c0_g1_i1:290-565(-)
MSLGDQLVLYLLLHSPVETQIFAHFLFYVDKYPKCFSKGTPNMDIFMSSEAPFGNASLPQSLLVQESYIWSVMFFANWVNQPQWFELRILI